MRSFCWVALLLLILPGLAAEETPAAPETQTLPQTPAASETPASPASPEGAYAGIFMHPNLLLDEKELAALKDRLGANKEPCLSAAKAFFEDAAKCLKRAPDAPPRFAVPGFYDQPELHNQIKGALRDDAHAAYTLALAARLTGEARFSEKALTFLNAWARNCRSVAEEDEARLLCCEYLPGMIFGADLMYQDPIWPREDRERFAQWLAQVVEPAVCMERENYAGNWGVLLTLSVAHFREDRELFAKGLARYRELVGKQMDTEGRLIFEIRRGSRGLWYSNFALLPMTLGAEVARHAGVDLYNEKLPDGRGLRKALDRFAPFVTRPKTWPHFRGKGLQVEGARYCAHYELAYAACHESKWEALLKANRPLSAGCSLNWATLTHGQVLPGDPVTPELPPNVTVLEDEPADLSSVGGKAQDKKTESPSTEPEK